MQQVHKTKDPIDVITIFTQKKAHPFSFKWSGKKYIVEKVNLVFSKQSGNGRLISYSVTAEGNYFKLTFETNEMKWYVEEVVME